MKKIAALAVLFALSSATCLKAQLFFCGNYTDTGEPMNVSNTFSLGEKGGYVYMLYSNKKKVIHSKALNIVLAKQVGKDYLPYAKDQMDVQDKKTWAVEDYHFTESGTFKVSILDGSHEIGKAFLSVFLKNSKNGDQTAKNDPDQGYYNATVSFCTGVEDGKQVGVGSTFTTGKVTVFLANDKELSSDSMSVMVYKKGPGSATYDQYVDYAKYGINPVIKRTYFEWDFTEGGEYSVEIYNHKYAKMGVGYITIQGSGVVDKSKDPDQSYYTATTTFCESVADGKPVGENTTFKTGQVYIYVLNDKALSTDSIIVDVMKKAYETEKFSIYITTKYYGVGATLRGTYFPLDFDESGQYKVSIYNRRMQRISEGVLTVR